MDVAEGGLENTNIRARFTNQMKSSDLTITKQVTGVTADDTEFTLRILFKFGSFGYISYPLECTVGGESAVLGNDGTISIKNGQSIVIEDIPVNAKVQIQEIGINQQYNYNGTTVTGADATNITNGTQFDMGEGAVIVTIENNKFSGFTISKELKYSPENNVEIEYPDNDSQFRIKIETSSDGSNYAPYANKEYTSSATTGTLTTDANGIALIKRGEKLSFNDLPVNIYVRVTEDTQSSTYSGGNYSTHDHMPLDYQLKDITAVKGGTEEEAPSYEEYKVDGNYYHGCTFQLANVNRVDVTVTNMKPRYRWIAKYTHQTRSVDIANPQKTAHSIWGNVDYQSEGYFTADELIEYTKFAMVVPDNSQTSDPVKGIQFKDNAAKAAFLMSKTPYQDNFKETVTWNLEGAGVGFYYNEQNGSQLSLTPSESLNKDYLVDISFRLPCKMLLSNAKDEWLPDESETIGGVPKAKFTADGMPDEASAYYTIYNKEGSKYAGWYCINDAQVGQTDKTPYFLYTPVKVYDVDANDYKYFKYWSVRTMTNKSSESVEYTRCYNNEYNYVFYQDSIVYAVYGEGEENKYDVARATESSANLSFLENSRNQWNIQATGSQIVSDFNGANNVKYGDRLFSDFVIDFHYVKDGKNLLLNEITDTENYKTGLLIETVRELTSAEVDTVNKKMLKTDKQIAESFKASENIEAKSNALAFLSGDNTNASKYINSTIDIGKFDNKNELEYAYSFANISQSKEYRNRTERKMKVYRAYAYLINTGAGTDTSGQPADVQIISEPVYFTIYDMASIENDYDIAVTKN